MKHPEKGEVTSVQEGHDVECVTEKMRSFAAVVKLAREIDELVSRDKVWKATLSCLSRPADCEGWEQKAPKSVSWRCEG